MLLQEGIGEPPKEALGGSMQALMGISEVLSLLRHPEASLSAFRFRLPVPPKAWEMYVPRGSGQEKREA